MSTTYLDAITYTQRQPTGLILAPYTGNLGRIAACTAGATSLTVPALSKALAQYDAVYLFDGPQSEVLQVGAAGAAINATSIPLQSPTAYAHSAGVAYCTDGAQGSVGEQIVTASQWVEDICHQSLWQTTYAGEILRMPSMRAALDNMHGLIFKPRHVPVTALTALSIATDASTSIAYDPTQAIIDSELEHVSVPNLQGIPGGSQTSLYQPLRPLMARQHIAWLTITYTAGFAVGSLPATVVRACSLLVNQCFAELYNAIGADSIVEGERNVVFTMRGDTTGESLLMKQAMKLLQPYIVEES